MAEIDVSVVLAVKDEEQYIESAVGSVLGQRGVRLEVIVVDDGSTDRTAALVEAAVAHDPRVHLRRNPRRGKCSAFNLGVAEARGRFTCIFAGDDLMPAGSLAARFDAVSGYPEDRPVVGLCKIRTFSANKRFDGAIVPRRAGRGALSGVSPLMNRLAVRQMFPVPESLPNEDTWMELAVLNLPGWTVVHSDIIGCEWRVHEGNSINMMMGFADYNRRITARMAAAPLFERRFGDALEDVRRRQLRGLIACEEARLRGDWFGILRTRVGVVDKLRSLSIVNPLLYNVRRRLYRLFSGW